MKGQSAVEYVMTYGWAILALAIVLGIIAFSGVLSPTYLISEECNLGTNLPCSFSLYNRDGQTHLGMQIYNGFSYKVRIEGVEVFDPDGQVYFTGDTGIGEVESGDSASFTVDYPGEEMSQDSFKRLVIKLKYASCAQEISDDSGCSSSYHVVSGRVSGRVNAGS